MSIITNIMKPRCGPTVTRLPGYYEKLGLHVRTFNSATKFLFFPAFPDSLFALVPYCENYTEILITYNWPATRLFRKEFLSSDGCSFQITIQAWDTQVMKRQTKWLLVFVDAVETMPPYLLSRWPLLLVLCGGERHQFASAGIIFSWWVQKGKRGTGKDKGPKEQHPKDNGANPSVSVCHHPSTGLAELNMKIVSESCPESCKMSQRTKGGKDLKDGEETDV